MLTVLIEMLNKKEILIKILELWKINLIMRTKIQLLILLTKIFMNKNNVKIKSKQNNINIMKKSKELSMNSKKSIKKYKRID
jgi:hypothetical protein